MFRKIVLTALAAFAVGVAGPVFAAETITVGITTTGVPFTFIDTATQKPTGAMVDLANAIAADNGAKAVFQVAAFPALIPLLTTGKIDLVSASMFITKQREKVVDFSTQVYSFGEAMFIAANDEKNYSVEDLKGEIVGAEIGSTTAHALTSLGIFRQVKLYESIADIMRDVKLGRIKAGFGDEPIVAYQLSQKPHLGIRMVKGYTPINKGQLALAVAKGNRKLLEQVNASIAKFRKDGRLAAIFAKYGL
ncbi:MAG: amino acid ABC transporter substrate-binding protein [Rhizobiaceae bacterium]|nr:MAG: amino acid ABC transporter substrate-binding protein [Rhizobiaceae bacterium]